jgi:hypothetical protein
MENNLDDRRIILLESTSICGALYVISGSIIRTYSIRRASVAVWLRCSGPGAKSKEFNRSRGDVGTVEGSIGQNVRCQ